MLWGRYMEQAKADDNLVVDTPKPIQWVIPDSIRTEHATHLVVQQQGTEFMLFFFEAETDLFTGTLEEQFAAYRNLPTQKAKCVAKVVMSVENVGQAANSLMEALNKMLQTMNMKGEENAEAPGDTESPTVS
jgi:hypothetical protein